MNTIKLAENVYWVGVEDWNIRNFHGHTYTTNRGTTYNAYLIIDEKITLIDTVHPAFGGEMLKKISEITDPGKIEYIVANHAENDHSGSLPQLHELCPGAKVIGTAKCKEALYKHYFGNWKFQAVRTGDTLKLGRKSLVFVEASMLHWPDSMFSYMKEDAILFSNDAFGQHYATSRKYDDEVDECALMDEAAKYYANILWPFGTLVLRKIEEIKKMNIPVRMIAPSHGIIWRKDPMKIVNSYVSWAGNKLRNKVIVIYETMWGATELMAKKISEPIVESGAEVKLYDIAKSDRTEIFRDMLDAKGFLIGSSTHDNNMLPNIACFLELLKGFKPRKRAGAAFGSYGWGGGAVKEIEGVLEKAGIAIANEGLSVQYMPDENEINMCRDYGKAFLAKMNELNSTESILIPGAPLNK